MDEEEKEYHVYRIMCGYTILEVGGTTYIVDTPTPKIINQGNYLYRQAINKNRYSGMMGQERARNVLVKNKLWSLTGDNNLKEIEKSLEEAKLELYHAFFLTEKAMNNARKKIELIKAKRIETLLKKHHLDDSTIEGLAEHIKETYIFSCLILNQNYEAIDVDGLLLKNIMDEYRKQMLDHSKYRLLARTDPWLSIWNAKGMGAFREIGQEQLFLGGYTKMYENAQQYPEPPPKAMIEDDDLFDGWLIFIQRENAHTREQKTNNKFFDGKYKNAGEVFIPVETQADVNRVNGMNDVTGRIIKEKINQKIDKDGSAFDLDIQELALQHQLKARKG